MATTKLTSNTLASKYRDDFDVDKGYHRILFNNERHLQARELTQLQTIIQEEIKIFGKNIFKEGAAANPGGANLNRKVPFIKLDSTSNVPSDISTLIGKTFEGASSGVQFRVVDAVAATGSDPATLYVAYTSRSALQDAAGQDTTVAAVAQAGEGLDELEGNLSLKVQVTDIAVTNPATGFGTVIQINEAEFFTLGFFVRAPQQKLIVSKYTNNWSGTVGFRGYQEIVDANDDPSLFDNQGLLPNTTAPGADRLKITLELIDKEDIQEGETFIYYATIKDSRILDQVTGYDNYNKINEFAAKRTEEESGDYTVKPFHLRMEEDTTDDTKIKARVSTGIAYINGFRVVKQTPTFLEVNKPVDTITHDNEAVGADFGYYVIVKDLQGLEGLDTLETLTISAQSQAFTANINTHVNLDTGSDAVVFPTATSPHTSATNQYYHIGTCRIKSVEAIGDGRFRVYLMDVKMFTEEVDGNGNPLSGDFRIPAGQKFTFKDYARSIGRVWDNTQTYASYVVPELTGTKAVIREVNNADMLFPLPRPMVKEMGDMRASRIQKYTSVQGGNSTSLSLSAGTGSAVFVDPNAWIVLKQEDDGTRTILSTSSELNIQGIGNAQATISLSANGITNHTDFGSGLVEIISYVSRDITSATKTRSTFKGTISYDEDLGYAQLDATDIIKISVLKYGSDQGPNAINSFVLDNGQRDTHYQNGKLIAKVGRIPQEDTLYVEYDYYQHLKDGDFFSVNSYSDPYGENPTYKNTNGETLNLINFLDFRPTMGDNGTFTSSDAIIKLVPQDADVLTGEVTYYASRKDKIVLSDTGDLTYIEGTSAANPIYPSTPDQNLELFRIDVPGNVNDLEQIRIQTIDNKRYTMRDIGKLDQRITQMERVTSLSLLELDTKNIDVLDADGRNRAKSGFFVDNFASGYNSDVRNPDYRASIDILNKVVRPSYKSNHIGLFYVDQSSTNTVLKGDNVYLDYTHEKYISNEQANSTIEVNPYLLMGYNGHITLSPASDTWHVTEYMDPNIIDGGTVVHYDGSLRWNDWNFSWHGVDVNDLQVGDNTSQTQVTGSSTGTSRTNSGGGTTETGWLSEQVTTVVNTITSSDIVLEKVGDREVSVDLIPFMRSRFVSFKGEGLMPNSRVWPYFDGVDVSDYCRKEAFSFKSIQMLNNNIDADKIEPGTTYDLETEVPGGATDLYTDGNGRIEGVFFIPNNSSQRFRTGEVEFKLLDVSVNKDENAISKAKTIFTSTGYLHTRQEDILSTRHLEVTGTESTVTRNTTLWSTFTPDPGDGGDGDPIAQSFTIGEDVGSYATKVTLYFESKDDNPVWVQLRPMVNGYPSSNTIVPGSYKLLESSEVLISDDASVGTDFEFDEPVYLKGNTDYCVMVQTVTNAYKVWTSKVGEFEFGTTEKRVAAQPFFGSLFKSQNSRTWEPLQWEDLKFDLHRANFGENATGKAVLANHSPAKRLLGRDPIEIWYDNDPDATNPAYFRVHHPDHGFLVGDTVTIEGVDETANAYWAELNGDFTVDVVDHTGYLITMPAGIPTSTQLNPNQPIPVGGDEVIVTENYAFTQVQPVISMLEPAGTSSSLKGQFVTTTSFNGTETPYQQDGAETFDLVNEEDNYLDEFPRVIRNRGLEPPAQGPQGKSAIITVNLSSKSPYVCPMIDMQRAALTLVNNIIDNPSDDETVGNVPIGYVPETSPSGGTTAAKHICRPVSLLNAATGLKVIIAANRPSVCGMDLYYKIAQGADLTESEWVLANPDNLVPSDENSDVFREYEYTIGGTEGTLADFDQFQLKMVFTSTNSAKVPVLRDIRAIALGS